MGKPLLYFFVNNNYCRHLSNFLFITVDKMTHMVGSYPPKKEIQFYLTPAEEAPSGMVSRGTYSVSSVFTDDDKHIHLKWDWTFEIKKDWA